MPTSVFVPSSRTWIEKTTSIDGTRFIESKPADAPLLHYGNCGLTDFAGRGEAINKLLEVVERGRDQCKNKPALEAQFFALHRGLLYEIKSILKDKQAGQFRKPKVQLGKHRNTQQIGQHRERKSLSDAYAFEGMDPQHRFGMFWRAAEMIRAGEGLSMNLPETDSERQALIDWVNQREGAIWQATGWSPKHVEYLDPGQRWRYRLIPIRGGQVSIFQQQSKYGLSMPFTTGGHKVNDGLVPGYNGWGRAIWVMDTEGNIYSASHETGRFHHSSFLGGGLVICGGEIATTPEGELFYISNKTGHYKAGPGNLLNAIRRLEDHIDFANVIANLNFGPEGEFWCWAVDFRNAQGRINKLNGQKVDVTHAPDLAWRRYMMESIQMAAQGKAPLPTLAFPPKSPTITGGMPAADAGEYVDASAIGGESEYVPASMILKEG